MVAQITHPVHRGFSSYHAVPHLTEVDNQK
jgi:hypothetical protein